MASVEDQDPYHESCDDYWISELLDSEISDNFPSPESGNENPLPAIPDDFILPSCDQSNPSASDSPLLYESIELCNPDPCFSYLNPPLVRPESDPAALDPNMSSMDDEFKLWVSSDSQECNNEAATSIQGLSSINTSISGEFCGNFALPTSSDGVEMISTSLDALGGRVIAPHVDGLGMGSDEGHSDGSEAGNEDSEAAKRQARLMRNRESAQLSRQRKKVYVDELETKLRTMQATVTELNATIAHLTAENVNLRRQLAAGSPANATSGGKGGIGPVLTPAPAGMIPFGVFGFHHFGLGGMVPAVPIPRLKSKSTVSAKPARKAKAPADGEGSGSKGKRMKKAAAGGAGVAALALFCFAMLFSPFGSTLQSPMAVKHSLALGGDDSWAAVSASSAMDGGHGGGRVLMSVSEGDDGWENRTESKEYYNGNYSHSDVQKVGKSSEVKSSAGGVQLYALKSIEIQKLKAMAVVAVEKQRTGGLKALPAVNGSSGGGSSSESISDGDHWIMGDFHGVSALLAPGFCTEVFRFDTSSSSPRDPEPCNATSAVQEKVASRKWLRSAVPLPPISSNRSSHGSGDSAFIVRGDEDKVGGESGAGNSSSSSSSSASSVVVSLLASPFESCDSTNEDCASKQRRLSQIFVVVLLNGAKYVTYSCVLPSVSKPTVVTP